MPERDFAYVLGLYLGDGYINQVGDPSKGVWVLRIMCAHAWPGLQDECKRAHGPGKKHERKIELMQWQREITDVNPGAFARGLFHSDGSRFLNRVRRPLSEGDHWYEYPRYMFTNESADILQLCGQALDQLGVAWRFSRRNTISVARREAVDRLDQFVGPKF